MVFDARPLIVHVVDTLEGGGTERGLLALLGSLSRTHLRHAVITLREAGALSARLPEDISCRPLGLRGASRTAGFRLARVLRQLGAAAVHGRNTCTWCDTTVAGLLTRGVRVVLGFHGWDQGAGWSARRIRATRACARLGARFSSVSCAGRDWLVKDLRISRERITVLPNGVDAAQWLPPDEAQRMAARARWGFDNRDVVVVAVGSLSAVKRHDRLLAATTAATTGLRTNSLRVLIAGEGPLRPSLHAQAESMPLCPHVVFAGHLQDARAAYHAADVFVCSSDAEGVSHALLEAMATGLPVVTTAVGDHAQIVRDGDAGIVVERTVEALTRALLRLGSDEKLRREMGALARRRAEQFSFAATVAAHEAFYRSLIECPYGRNGPTESCSDIAKTTRSPKRPEKAASIIGAG